MSDLTRMSCEETFRRLDDYLDRELSAEEMGMVREHLETCAVCATEFDFEQSVLDLVKEKLRRLDVSPDLARRIARALDQVEQEG
ncbi:MAG TPA: zf-HC2 domain-containing protein [Gemmatimonadales bacterium]